MSQEECKTLDVINKLPQRVSTQMRKIYEDMVTAKQNCEAIAFRGHRLLDQVRRCVQALMQKKFGRMVTSAVRKH